MWSLFLKLILVIACWQGGIKPIFGQRLDRPDFFEQGVAASESLDQSFLADPEQLLTQVRDRIVQKQNNFTLQETDTLEFQGYPAKDFILKSNEETLTFRLFLARDHLYILAVGLENEISSVNFITEFFESFQFL